MQCNLKHILAFNFVFRCNIQKFNHSHTRIRYKKHTRIRYKKHTRIRYKTYNKTILKMGLKCFIRICIQLYECLSHFKCYLCSWMYPKCIFILSIANQQSKKVTVFVYVTIIPFNSQFNASNWIYEPACFIIMYSLLNKTLFTPKRFSNIL